MSDAIEPDTKDWTWVLRERCPECGLDSAAVEGRDLPALVRGWGPRWVTALARPDATRRPRPEVWSVLEYACHVRDVYLTFDERVRLMVTEHAPTFANWDQDEAAVEGRYAEQDPALVADELVAAGEHLAERFAAVGPDEWSRTGLRSNGSAFTVETLGQYFAHDVVHHLHDVSA
ncbi:DinB family protein [Actinotalea sp. BY-33]|uniref:DinB family protein n=1 Tax=Actinotalea soli TaxID=2819234 RepID=A0A939LNT9_9CELL|nr:DinB family protein [Actinotalea soli]MBO1751004.1 DinB family protein [Actinotalea soli]